MTKPWPALDISTTGKKCYGTDRYGRLPCTAPVGTLNDAEYYACPTKSVVGLYSTHKTVVFLLLNVFLFASSCYLGADTTATRKDNIIFLNELYRTKDLFIAVHGIQVCVILTVGTVGITNCTRVHSLPVLTFWRWNYFF